MRRIASKISVVGCGTWPTTIAKILVENGNDVTIWCHRQSIADEINEQHTHKKVLPDCPLPQRLFATTDLKKACEYSDAIVIGLASSYYYHIPEVANHVTKKPILSLTKGLLSDQHLVISTYLCDVFKSSPIAVLSGPNLAKEIAFKKPAATVVASPDSSPAHFFQNALSNTYFRVYTSSDRVGVELGGVLKNIMAIAAGISDKLGLGSNAKAALITRGLQEMVRFSSMLQAKPETLYGLSGLGDLIATCDSSQSRNYRVGLGLASGLSVDTILKELGQHAEGINTTKVVIKQAQEWGVDMPISQAVHDVLFSEVSPHDALMNLMKRGLKAE